MAVFDYNRDGLFDLYVPAVVDPASPGPKATPSGRLLEQRPSHRFVDVTDRSGLAAPTGTCGVAAADYDADGFIDLVLVGPRGAVLYRNHRDSTFREVTAYAGLNRARGCTSSLFFDANGDSWLDLLILSAVPGASTLYRNNRNGTFADVTGMSGLSPLPAALSALAADLDGDGKQDLGVLGHSSRFFRNQGEGRFVPFRLEPDVSSAGAEGPLHAAGVWNDGGYGPLPGLILTVARPFGVPAAWGCAVADFDADGFEDICMAQETYDSTRPSGGRLFRGLPGKRFEDLSWSVRASGGSAMAHGCVAADLDADGRLDIVETAPDRPIRILLNRSSSKHHSLQLRLVGKGGNLQAIGARVAVTAAGRTQYRQVTAGGYLGSFPEDIFIGLGTASSVDRVEVSWPSGAREIVPIRGVPSKPVILQEP